MCNARFFYANQAWWTFVDGLNWVATRLMLERKQGRTVGPITLFDKSFLESLNPDEAVWFDHFFLANVCPMFYAETQSDLAKEASERGTPEEFVRRLANKFPDFSGSPNVHHTTICTANLLGEEVSMAGQVVVPKGCHGTVSGHRMAILPESPEAKAFLRWAQGDYDEEERHAAAEWRSSDKGRATSEVLELLEKLKIDVAKPSRTLTDVRAIVDYVLEQLTPVQAVYLAMQLLEVRQPHGERTLMRFKEAGEPTLRSFAPYADFCLRVELFFHLAVYKSKMSEGQRIDLRYLFYLPFCQIFVSGDWVHRDSAPLFLRADQEFVAADKLKAALRALNEGYSALPAETRAQAIHQIATSPPKEGENLVTQLWDRHFQGWRTPRMVTAAAEELKAVTSSWKERIAELQEIAETTGGAPGPVSVEGLDALIMRRVARKQKGSWWLVPEDLRRAQPPQLSEEAFEFSNGASAANVIDQEIEVYILTDSETIGCMPECRTYLRDGQLWVDCAPPLNRKHVAPIPRGALISGSANGIQFAAFVMPKTELGKLVTRLWAEEASRRGGTGKRSRP